MPRTDFLHSFDVPFDFVERPETTPADFRPLWRIALLVLILDKCWGQRASIGQVHLLNWAIRTKQSRDAFLSFQKGLISHERAIVRFEPSLNRAIDFAFGEGLIRKRANDVIEMTIKGRAWADRILSSPELLGEEREFLTGIKGKITQQAADALLNWERNA